MMAHRYELTLTEEEIDALNTVIATGTATRARRAQIILRTAEGLTQVAIAAEVGLSERQVRRWQKAFEAERMAIFPGYDVEGQVSVTPAVQSKKPHPPSDVPGLTTGVPAELKERPSIVSEPALPVLPALKQELPGVDKPRRELKLSKNTGIKPDDAMGEAGRKILFYQFERMLLHEPGSRQGEDIEAVHDMRVATRRMRSAFRIFMPFYRRKAIRPFVRGLRQTARVLGEVRDLEVMIEKQGLYRESLDPDVSDTLEPLIMSCEDDLALARARLIAYLDSSDFARFVEGFSSFLTKPGAGALKVDRDSPNAYQVRHIVPRLIYTRYEAVRAYETVLTHASISTLHALRIECKRLRYALEFFEEVLGPEAKGVINEIKTLQDHLGDLNDAEVAENFLREFVINYEKAQTNIRISERQSIEQVVQYMAFQFAEKHRLITTFPETWDRFNRYDVRRDLALAIAAL